MLRTLNGTSGAFVAGPVLVAIGPPVLLGLPPAPPGMIIDIEHIAAVPRNPSGLPDPQVFGYDATAAAADPLRRRRPAPSLQRIPCRPRPMVAGVGLGRNGGHLVALVSDGSTVYAFNAIDRGAATASSPPPVWPDSGPPRSTASASTDTARSSPTRTRGTRDAPDHRRDPAASPHGPGAVPVGPAFTPQRQFQLSGGLTGVPASNSILAAGVAPTSTARSSPTARSSASSTVDTPGGTRSTRRPAPR